MIPGFQDHLVNGLVAVDLKLEVPWRVVKGWHDGMKIISKGG